MKLRYNPNGPQLDFHKDITTPILLYQAGLGSGKTWGLCHKALQLSFLNKNTAGAMLAPNFNMYKRDILPTFMDIFEINKLKVKINLTDKTFIFPWSKYPMYIFTAEKPIAGPNLGWCCINEFSLMPYERVNEMMRRVRVSAAPNPQRCFAGTPEDIYGWLEDFVEGQKVANRIKIIRGNTMDNLRNLSEDYIEQLRTTLDPVALRLFMNGEMVRLGTDYFYYAYRSDKNDNKDLKRDPYAVIHAAMDFNVGRMTCLLAHKVGEQIHVFDEIVLGGNSDTNQMADALLARYSQSDILITCDAAGKARKTSGLSDVDILRARGFEVRYRSANPRLRKRQLLVNGLLHNGRILIHPEKCKTLKRDLAKVEQHKATFDKVKTNPDMTHASDCLDYLCDFEFNFSFDRQNRTRSGYIGGTL